jgi:hypothetical protein
MALPVSRDMATLSVCRSPMNAVYSVDCLLSYCWPHRLEVGGEEPPADDGSGPACDLRMVRLCI